MISFCISISYIASDDPACEAGEVFYKQEVKPLELGDILPTLHNLFSGLEFPIPRADLLMNGANEVIGFCKALYDEELPEPFGKKHVLALVTIFQVDDSPPDLNSLRLFE